MFSRTITWLILLAAACAAQQPPAQFPRIDIRKIEGSHVKVDGRLDEPVWGQLQPITNFVQTQPDLGAPVSERTEAYVFYDSDNIYLGFKFYDSNPSGIIARLGSHDSFTGSDSVDILVDTFHDRRTGYFFSINSKGIQFDATLDEANGSHPDSTWDGIWYSASRVEDWGWSCEVAIPFKSIRLSGAQDQSWGLNIGRDIPRKQERAYWSPVARFDGFMRPSKAGTINGMRDVHVGRNLEVIPFVASSLRHADWLASQNDYTPNAGIDVRYGLSANLTANFTVNPDFSETEADEFNSSVSRFEIFFPEKRKFFTEGASYFAVPLQMFFSRRIGSPLPDGSPQRVLEGGKITGKTGRWTIGVLEALTQEKTVVDPTDGLTKRAPQTFFGVLRLQRDILEKSSIGFMTVNRVQGRGDIGQSESSHGIDFTLLKGEHIYWTSQLVFNQNDVHPGTTTGHLGGYAEFRYNSELWEVGVANRYLGDKLDFSNTGFEPETGRWAHEAYVTFKPFINKGIVRQLFVHANRDQLIRTTGELDDAGTDFEFQVQFKNFWSARTRYSYDQVRFNEFTPTFVALPTEKLYRDPKIRFYLDMPTNRAFSVSLNYTYGKMFQFDEGFHGWEKLFQATIGSKIGPSLRLDLTAINIRESLDDRTFFQDRRFLISRLTYFFTPKLRTRVLAQYSDRKAGSNFSVNSLLAYDFTARSAFYFGYTRQRHVPFEAQDLGHEVFFKLSYLFGF